MNGDARMLASKPAEHSGQQSGIESLIATDPDLAHGRVGQKLDVLDGLAKSVEDGNAAVEQSATVFGRRHALAAAIEQADPDETLQFRDGPRDRRLCRVKERGGLVHAPRLGDGHEDMQVMQSDPQSNAIARLHRSALL